MTDRPIWVVNVLPDAPSATVGVKISFWSSEVSVAGVVAASEYVPVASLVRPVPLRVPLASLATPLTFKVMVALVVVVMSASVTVTLAKVRTVAVSVPLWVAASPLMTGTEPEPLAPSLIRRIGDEPLFSTEV